MNKIDETLPDGVNKEWKDDVKQYYVEYEKNGHKMKMWIEDEKSFAEKLSLISENNLAGCSIWQKGLETDNVWELINNELKK